MRIYNVPLAGKVTPVVTPVTGSIVGLSGTYTDNGNPLLTIRDTGKSWTEDPLIEQGFITRHVYVIFNDFVGAEGFGVEKGPDDCWYAYHLSMGVTLEHAISNAYDSLIGLPEIKEDSTVRHLGFVKLGAPWNGSALVIAEELLQDRTGIIAGVGDITNTTPNVEAQFMNIQ